MSTFSTFNIVNTSMLFSQIITEIQNEDDTIKVINIDNNNHNDKKRKIETKEDYTSPLPSSFLASEQMEMEYFEKAYKFHPKTITPPCTPLSTSVPSSPQMEPMSPGSSPPFLSLTSLSSALDTEESSESPPLFNLDSTPSLSNSTRTNNTAPHFKTDYSIKNIQTDQSHLRFKRFQVFQMTPRAVHELSLI